MIAQTEREILDNPVVLDIEGIDRLNLKLAVQGACDKKVQVV
jgi:hypothetical protein